MIAALMSISVIVAALYLSEAVVTHCPRIGAWLDRFLGGDHAPVEALSADEWARRHGCATTYDRPSISATRSPSAHASAGTQNGFDAQGGHMSTINELLATLNTQMGELRKGRKPATIAPHVVEALERGEYLVPAPVQDGEHDWASYDSSDIHQRTAEWETQANMRPTIQHFTPTRKPMRITAAQLAQANTALDKEMPGVTLGANLRQNKAHELLVGFLGADAADRIMTGGE